MKGEKCKRCKYRYGEDMGVTICGYLIFTGKRRGCPPDNCDKFESTTKKRMVDVDGQYRWVEGGKSET